MYNIVDDRQALDKQALLYIPQTHARPPLINFSLPIATCSLDLVESLKPTSAPLPSPPLLTETHYRHPPPKKKLQNEEPTPHPPSPLALRQQRPRRRSSMGPVRRRHLQRRHDVRERVCVHKGQ